MSDHEHFSNEVDDLFDYDVGLDEVLKNIPVESNQNTTKETGTNGNDPVLGLDEEVKVTKQRAPVAKLDEARLLSQNGIPKLRRTAKSKLKFKGKGHEFSDMARLLNFYQLWLDDLFPRAKFADGLAMIEKLGHSKRIQIMRKEWIGEDKSTFTRADAIVEENTSTEAPNHGVQEDISQREIDMVLAELEESESRPAPDGIE